ncbi:hypothetical protein [uncultured Psychroserpens sp.]|uniref:hypothetical protein n=1 Tax=uncultured Psychroserpens sp. TaxID=255436 RepID=UPI0026251189|nr:hypothetical protein [uncultured Psychroserpens sp.]
MKTLIFILITIFACDNNEKVNSVQNEFEVVSLIDLIANPEKYDGRKVMIKGYLNFSNEGHAIYLSKGDFDYGHYKNALYINISDAEIIKRKINYTDNAHGTIIGIFSKDDLGHRRLFSGSLKKIEIIEWTEKRD